MDLKAILRQKTHITVRLAYIDVAVCWWRWRWLFGWLVGWLFHLLVLLLLLLLLF